MFAGFVELGGSLYSGVLAVDGTEVVAPDEPPAFAVYGPAGAMPHGSGVCSKLGDDDGLYSYAITLDPQDGYALGATYTVAITYLVDGASHGLTQSFTVT